MSPVINESTAYDMWEGLWFVNATIMDENGPDERTVGTFVTQHEAEAWANRTLPNGSAFYVWRMKRPTEQ